MGSYAEISGNFTTDKPVSRACLDSVEKACEIFPGFAHEYSIHLKDAKARKQFKDRYFHVKAEWKGFMQSDTLKLAKDLYKEFSKQGIKILRGEIRGDHEYGEKWKVTISDKEITLHEGVVVYKPIETVKIEVTEQVTRSSVVNFV